MRFMETPDFDLAGLTRMAPQGCAHNPAAMLY
jgi:hypothetical protein